MPKYDEERMSGKVVPNESSGLTANRVVYGLGAADAKAKITTKTNWKDQIIFILIFTYVIIFKRF